MSKFRLRRACARAQPKSFALLAPGDGPGLFKVNMFDIASNRWRMFETSPEYSPKCAKINIVSASDGGLVCFLSKSKKTPRLVFVCNPLTRVWKQLPPLSGIVQHKIMVQLIMDREPKHYRVVVVGYCKDPEVENLVNVYHSETGQWTKADGSSSGEVVCGYLHNFNPVRFPPAPCSYNFADGLVRRIGSGLPGKYACDSVLVKDHLFRLKVVVPAGGLQTHCIEEYQAVDCGASSIPLKEHPFNRLPRSPQRIEPDDMSWFTRFCGSKDFLLLSVFNKLREVNRCQLFFIYEFSKEEWREVSLLPGGYHSFFAQKQMYELGLILFHEKSWFLAPHLQMAVEVGSKSGIFGGFNLFMHLML